MAEKPTTCPVCSDDSKGLIPIPCCRYGCCKKCLEKISENNINNEVTCPQCQQKHKVPTGGVEDWRDATEQRKQLETVTPQKIPTESPPTLRKCSVHDKYDKECYCKTCDKLICFRCFAEGHNGHENGFIDQNTRREVQEKIHTLISDTKATFTKAQEHFEYINSIEIAKGERKEKEHLESQIKEHFDPRIAQLQRQRDETLKEAEEECNGDQKKIWSRQTKFEDAIKNYKKALDDSEEIVESDNDQKVIQDGQDIINALQNVTKLGLDLKDTEALELESRKYTPPSSEDLGKIELVTTEPELILDPKLIPQTVYLKEEVRIELQVSLKIGEYESKKKGVCKPCVKITHGHNQVEIPDHTIERKEDKWLISFHPVVAGHHSIVVSVETDFACKKISNRMDHSIKVKGKKSIQRGDTVERGPDWCQQDERQEVGTVLKVDEGKVQVKWVDKEEEWFKWGLGGSFEVQLKHVDSKKEA
ncbi:uncharacterized protein LOC135346939 isoform X2 [Halichondria panicea]|uniref:uncharacterized protein LOC135346939 isoform X2 n=1 Tax=Halichondria panicea TaxID=6063 RepID=UPI00312BAC03